METVEIPSKLVHRPTFRGMVIPFTALVGAAGIPDFKVTHMDNWARCATDKLCGICGEPLDYWVWWIGGEKSTSQGVYFDPAMHEVCARYAAAVCPFIVMARGYSNHLKEYPGMKIHTKTMANSNTMFLNKTRRNAMKVTDANQFLAGTSVHQEEISRVSVGEPA